MPLLAKDNKLIKHLLNLIEVQNPSASIEEFLEVV